MISKNLFDQSLKHTWYNINPKTKTINLTLKQYEYYIKQELIAKALIKFIENRGFSVVQEEDNLYIEKNNNITTYEKWEGDNNE